MADQGSGHGWLGRGTGGRNGAAALLLSLGLPGAALPASAYAQAEPQQSPRAAERDLQAVERDLKEAEARRARLDAESGRLETELAELRARAIDAAAQARARSAELAEIEAELAGLSAEEADRLARLDADRAALAELLVVLQRLARLPPEALLARPEPPSDTLRTALLLRSAVPELRARADVLARELEDLAKLRETLAARRVAAETATAALTAQEQEIAKLVERRTAIAARTAAERDKLAARQTELAAKATDLKALIDGLEAARAAETREREAEEAARAARAKAEVARRQVAAATRPPDPPTSAATARISPVLPGMMLPVGGADDILVRYGEADKAGAVSRGLTLRARAAASVVAPADGTVAFAGPFKGYGLILILEHPRGYHTLLAGLGRIDAEAGQQVLAGEPVGTMEGGAVAGDGTSTLYFELRRAGQPINPLRSGRTSQSTTTFPTRPPTTQPGVASTDGKGHG